MFNNVPETPCKKEVSGYSDDFIVIKTFGGKAASLISYSHYNQSDESRAASDRIGDRPSSLYRSIQKVRSAHNLFSLLHPWN